MPTQLSAPQIDAQSVIKKMSLSSCRFRLSTRGFAMDEKCVMMDVAGIVSVFMRLGYHNMVRNTLLCKGLFRNDEGIILTKKCPLCIHNISPNFVKKTFLKQSLFIILMRLPWPLCVTLLFVPLVMIRIRLCRHCIRSNEV